jgi:hypothetical protein
VPIAFVDSGEKPLVISASAFYSFAASAPNLGVSVTVFHDRFCQLNETAPQAGQSFIVFGGVNTSLLLTVVGTRSTAKERVK